MSDYGPPPQYGGYPPQPITQPAPKPPKRGNPWPFLAVIGLVVAVAAGFIVGRVTASSSSDAAGSPSASSTVAPMIAVHGSVTLTDPEGYDAGGSLTAGHACFGSGGYDDITGGAQVVISDDAGTTLKIVSLATGHLNAEFACLFRFTASVPAGHGFYGVTVTHRGTVKESESALPTVALTLG